MEDRYLQMTKDQFDEQRLEIENRIKNLFWTVSGDYTLNVKPDLELFQRSKYTALYDAVKQGAFAKYFDSEKLSLYLMKKIYCSAEETPLLELAQLCVDAAVYPLIVKERLGSNEIKKRAFTDILATQKAVMNQTFFGRVRLVMIKRFLGEGDRETADAILKTADDISSLAGAVDTDEIIGMIEKIYNSVFDSAFETKHGNLQQILNIPVFEIAQSAWQDFLTDEQMEDVIKKYLSSLGKDAMSLSIEDKPKARRPFVPGERPNTDFDAEILDEAAIKKVGEYVELNYGKSYLTPLELERKNSRLCKGIHTNCTLHFTEGVLHNPVKANNQYRFSQLQFEKNRAYYGSNHWIVKRNIAILAETLKKALVMRSEEDVSRWNSGQLVPARLWKLRRTNDKKLFNKKMKSENSEFVVDVLLDSSGSQAKRQSQVAIQGFIISEALSAAGIAHRVVSYCTFWDHTILNRFRDYDDKKDMNSRIFEFRASGDNRDGLAIRATYDSLMERDEENKILIILSDGKPCDLGMNRPGTKKPKRYQGEDAVKDTAFEVRRARACGISVLGIFAGSEEDLPAEKKIYGKDFAYIRDVSNFSHIVGTYLRKQLEKE